jgi:hypothetical protein
MCDRVGPGVGPTATAQPSAERVEKEAEAEKIFTTEVSAREEALVSI